MRRQNPASRRAGGTGTQPGLHQIGAWNLRQTSGTGAGETLAAGPCVSGLPAKRWINLGTEGLECKGRAPAVLDKLDKMGIYFRSAANPARTQATIRTHAHAARKYSAA
jgi:hypothetical protein